MSLALSLPVTNPVLVFALAMVIILVAPLLFERFRIPGLVGLILTGALVGPSALGLLERDDTFILLGTVGLLYLMFMAGLSLDLNQFAKLRARSLSFGTLSFLFPQLLALGGTMLVLGYSLPQALLIGSIVGSHTLLAYPIVQRLGIVKNTAITMTMGATMVTDLISLTILAIVVALTAGDIGLGFWTQFIGLVGLYVAAVWLLLPRLGRWFFKSVRKQPEVEFVFLMAVLFAAAYVAELVGLAAIIGAFLVGLAMNRLVPPQSPLMTRIRFVGNALFIPFFLISVGMLVDFGVLAGSLTVWGLALFFTGFIVVGKLGAAKAAQWLYGYTSEEGWAIFGLSSPQAAATLAVTLIGFEIGLLDTVVVNAVVVVILLTCLLGPWLVERYGRAVALQEETKPYEPSEAPQRILVPLANPETADDLMQLALFLHSPKSDQPIYPITITRDGPEAQAQIAAAEKMLSHAVVYGAAADVPVTPLTRIDLNIAEGLAHAVKEERISTLVIGWSGENTARAYIFGSILDQLLEETREMVVVSRINQPINTTKRLLLAVPPLAEREPGFAGACRAMKIFAEQTGAELVLFTTAEREPQVTDRVERTKPEVPVRPVALPSWARFMDALDEEVQPGDLIVLLSVRSGTLAWRSSLDRLPRVIAQRYPKHNFLTTYLSEVPISSIVQKVLTSRRRAVVMEAIRPELTTINLPDGSIERVLTHLLGEGLSEEEEAKLDVPDLVDTLLHADPDYVPELLPGVVLYHAHTRNVDALHLFAGVHREGLRPPRAGNPAHVILVLLAPKTMPPEDYLHKLTVTTQLVRTEEMVDDLRRCSTDEEAHLLLLDHLQSTQAA